MSKEHTLEMEPFQGNSRPKTSKWDRIFHTLSKDSHEETNHLVDANVKKEIDLKDLKNYVKKEGTSYSVSVPIFMNIFELKD